MKRPSCFGLPSVFSFESATCTGCRSRTDCIKGSYALLTKLSKDFAVSGELELYRINAGDLVAEVGAKGVSAPAPATSRPAPRARVDDASRFSATLTPEQVDKLQKLPVKVSQKLRTLMLKGIDRVALAELKRGQNPFVGHPMLACAGMMLLQRQPLSTATLKGELIRHFNWSEGTAASRASVAMGVLKAIGVPAEIQQG